MTVKILDLATLMEALVTRGAPEAVKPQMAWYTKIAQKVTDYAVELLKEAGADLEQVPSPNGPSTKCYAELCEMLLETLPMRAEDARKIEDLEDQINIMAKVILHFATKYPAEGLAITVTHDQLDTCSKKFEGIGVGECPAHGIHVDLIEVGSRGKHAH